MQDMASGWTAEDSIFVLQAHHVDVVEVQKLSRFLIRLHLVLGERPPHPGGIVVSFFGVIHRERQQSSRPVLCGNGAAQVGGEGSDSTMSRKVVPDHGDPAGQGWLRVKSRTRRYRPFFGGTLADDFEESLGW